ncbi:MAG: S41 family peptidase [Bryobacteraceae bacterium]
MRLFLPHFTKRTETRLCNCSATALATRKDFPAVRLWFDLLADLAISIFRDRRFVQPALIGTSAARHFDGVPSFHDVEGEPPRLLALVLGGLLSLVGLGAFPVLINHSANDWHPDTPTGRVLFGMRALPPGALIEDVKLDASERKRVIDGVISRLKEYYVYPNVAQKMADALAAHERAGDYNAETDGAAFAELLTKELRDISHDRHLRVVYNPFKTTDHAPGAPDDDADFRKELERNNCAFQKVEILPHNVGYLKLNAFPPPSICRSTAVAAMGFLAHVDAIIFDLRDNHGGDPNMVALLATYLFDRPTHLNDIYNRHENSTQQYWTLADVLGKRLADKPAYVLTSPKLFRARRSSPMI